MNLLKRNVFLFSGSHSACTPILQRVSTSYDMALYITLMEAQCVHFLTMVRRKPHVILRKQHITTLSNTRSELWNVPNTTCFLRLGFDKALQAATCKVFTRTWSNTSRNTVGTAPPDMAVDPWEDVLFVNPCVDSIPGQWFPHAHTKKSSLESSAYPGYYPGYQGH